MEVYSLLVRGLVGMYACMGNGAVMSSELERDYQNAFGFGISEKRKRDMIMRIFYIKTTRVACC